MLVFCVLARYCVVAMISKFKDYLWVHLSKVGCYVMAKCCKVVTLSIDDEPTWKDH